MHFTFDQFVFEHSSGQEIQEMLLMAYGKIIVKLNDVSLLQMQRLFKSIDLKSLKAILVHMTTLWSSFQKFLLLCIFDFEVFWAVTCVIVICYRLPLLSIVGAFHIIGSFL